MDEEKRSGSEESTNGNMDGSYREVGRKVQGGRWRVVWEVVKFGWWLYRELSRGRRAGRQAGRRPKGEGEGKAEGGGDEDKGGRRGEKIN